MLPVSKIIEKARIILKDNDGFQNSYKDDELLLYVNSAIRFLHMTIRNINPAYLIDYKASFDVEAGKETYELSSRIACITNVFFNGKRLGEINLFEIDNPNEKHTPKYFYVTNNKIINLYPIPNKGGTLKVDGISDIYEIGLLDYTPFNTEFDDFIVEYVVTRADMGDRFNIGQESSVMQYIASKVAESVAPQYTKMDVIRSY